MVTPPDGFDVIVESKIGRVTFSDTGSMHPRTAALRIIADHGEDGTYRFPGEDEGSIVLVTINTEPEAG